MASGCHTGQVALIQLGEFTALTLHILSCLPPCALVQMCRADPHSSEMLMDDTSSRKLSWIPLCSLIPQDPGTYPFSTFNLHTHSSFPTPTHESIPRVQSQYRMHLLPSQPSQHSESPAAIWRVSDQAPDGGSGSRLCHQGFQLQLHITKASLTPHHWPLPLGSCSCCCERSSP